ncbi:MAG: preprotein translocase subunit SecA [Proteobacteria bacterium]|nr:preprotein translocase subunit SecA [Pseudomonadota bacterium]
MFAYIAKRLWGSANDRIIKSFTPIIAKINELESSMQALSDAELAAKTDEFRNRINEGEKEDDLLPQAFAAVREAARRARNMRHFDVQLIGGIVLHRGMIAEMKTGEGKTLVATLAAYLNALSGKGVHVVTTNDYLAQRDAEWMGAIYRALGMSVSYITGGMPDADRQAAYGADITYGTNNEFGFDYLRDNLKFSLEGMVQRPFHYAIVDEVDSILIDESRTPLIISGQVDNDVDLYHKVNKLVTKLNGDHYELDEKARSAFLTDSGHDKIEELMLSAELIPQGTSLFETNNISLLHLVNQALKAHKLFKKDVEYIVKDDKIQIIDEFTGRIMDGRRFSEGLHQALEAKENVAVQRENQTLASVTYQNYFRMYPKLAGMTGTAMTEAQEFSDIYKLEVVAIPPNVPVSRVDEDDIIFRTEKEKTNAIVEEIKTVHTAKQPILIGTVSIEKSELLSKLLKAQKIPHTVLNARYHEQEAMIIAQAGRLGAVTIATNMAGRGTDIKLGGNEEMLLKQAIEADPELDVKKAQLEIEKQVAHEKQEVLAAGGLFILGTERHESRRIDNQLRGRSGRQGDPGITKFYLSLEDDLMRIFGSDRISSMLVKMGLKEGEAIVHPWVSKALEKAQQKVEARNYEIRKNLLKYDDVMNDQRGVIYGQRRGVLSATSLSELVLEFAHEWNMSAVDEHMPQQALPEQWDIDGLNAKVQAMYALELDLSEVARAEGAANEEMLNFINVQVTARYEQKRQGFEAPFLDAERYLFITILDHLWKEHLHTLDHLRSGIHLRSYGQKDPLNEYKLEAFKLFQHMMQQYCEAVVRNIFHLELHGKDDKHANNNGAPASVIDEAKLKEILNSNVGRNEPCPCGSGKKYKHCHGSLAA